MVREFLVWDSDFPTSFHTWLRDTDRTMILSVRSRRANGDTVRFADVAAAQPGSALHNDIVRWADRMRDYDAPVYFTYNHEPESSASFAMGDAPDFITAWRNVYQIFQERGATNVKFMWIMTDYAFWVGSQARNDAGKWYPGDDYLEAMGADAYNWYNCRPGINNPWKTLEQIIRPFPRLRGGTPERGALAVGVREHRRHGSPGAQGAVGQRGSGALQAAGLRPVPWHRRVQLSVHEHVPVVPRQQLFVGGRLPSTRPRCILRWASHTATSHVRGVVRGGREQQRQPDPTLRASPNQRAGGRLLTVDLHRQRERDDDDPPAGMEPRPRSGSEWIAVAGLDSARPPRLTPDRL